jgi:PAS domain S-box-containing protein
MVLVKSLMTNFRARPLRDFLPAPAAAEKHISVLLMLFGVLLFSLGGANAAAQSKAKNVLILFSSIDGNPYFTEVLEPAIRSRVPGPITFHISYLTYSQDPKQTELHEESLAETFRREYAGVKFDLVVAVAPQAFLFSLKYRDRIFPGTPIVVTQIGTSQFQGHSWPGVTGLTVPVGIRETIDLALRLHPDTTTIALIEGPDPYWIALTETELRRYPQVNQVVFTDPPSSELLAKVRALPPHTVVLFHLPLPSDIYPEFGAPDLLAGVADRWPTYSAWPENCLDHKCIGGAYPDLKAEHLDTAKIAARVLSGERPEKIPIAQDSSLQVRVDGRQLRRWHIPESALPANSVILYRESTFWQRYRNYVLAAIFVFLAQALLIAALLWQRTRKRKAEAVLRESEERFRVLANTTPALIWMFNAEGKINYLNDRRVAFTGQEPGEGYGDGWTKFIHPDDLPGVLDALSTGLRLRQPYSREYRLRRHDGVYRWMFGIASPRTDSNGQFAGFIGSSIDITEEKLARETLRKLSGYLMEAQEKERTRIARELHDDVCQRLALLSLELAQASRISNGASSRIDAIRKQCYEIARDVQSLSHRLHSSKLDYLGIVPALRGFCEEFSQQYEVSVEFIDTNVPGNIPHEISLCLFRVTQEALRNAVKYSDTRQYQVKLTGALDEVQLEVRDWGVGFNVEAAGRRFGLGLVSMQERVNLVHGRFSIESAPGLGTNITAVVPLHVNIESISDVEGATETASQLEER